MYTHKVLVSAPYLIPVIDEYRPMFEEKGIEMVVPKVRERLSESELLACVGDIDGIICGDDEITKRVLDAAPRLKVISKWGTGISSIDKEAAARRGIPVKNTPNAFTDSVADTALGLMLAFARHIPFMDKDMRAGRWEKRIGLTLAESAVGVVGLGNIGRAVVRRVRACGARILGYDVAAPQEEFVHQSGLELVPLETLLSESDFITLHCDLNPDSKYIIGEKEFAMMKPTAYIVNTARGQLINEKALVSALRAKQIAGAGLDVFEQEPLSCTSPLRTFDNVILSPHNANASPRAWRRVHENTINNAIEELKKHP